jgi:hypothetical protein
MVALCQPFALTVRDLLDSESRQRFLARAAEKLAIVVAGRLRGVSELLAIAVGLDAMNSIGVSG